VPRLQAPLGSTPCEYQTVFTPTFTQGLLKRREKHKTHHHHHHHHRFNVHFSMLARVRRSIPILSQHVILTVVTRGRFWSKFYNRMPFLTQLATDWDRCQKATSTATMPCLYQKLNIVSEIGYETAEKITIL